MKKGVVLVVIIGIMAVISALALAALHLMTQESRIVEHKIKRNRAFYAAQAGMVLALEKLRKGDWSGIPAGRLYCINGGCPPPNTVNDASILYDVTMRIFSEGEPSATNPFPDSGQIDIKVDY